MRFAAAAFDRGKGSDAFDQGKGSDAIERGKVPTQCIVQQASKLSCMKPYVLLEQPTGLPTTEQSLSIG
jgi:hypothetical protein